MSHQPLQQDIIERERSQNSLEESEARLSLAMSAANMGICDWNLINNQGVWTDNMPKLYGVPNGSKCPDFTDFLNLIYPENRSSVREAIYLGMEKGGELSIDYQIIWPDGTLHWLGSRGKVYHDENNRPIRLIIITTDICERKLAQQQIYEQAALLDIANDAIFVRDFQAQILYWNQGATKIYGWEKCEVLNKTIQEIFYKNISYTQERLPLKAVVKSGVWLGELHKETKLGKKVIVESRWTLMFDSDGQPKSILTVDTDITYRKELQEQFFRSQRIESIGSLSSGIAHDISNILTPILGSAQLLKIKLSSEQECEREMLTTIEINAKRGASLIKQLLSFGRGVSEKSQIINLKDLIKEIMQFTRTFPKNIEFSQHIDQRLSFTSGNFTQLYQVLINLLINASDAMPQGGKIDISAENFYIDETYQQMNCDAKVGNYVVISISDTGEGIKPENLERIFEQFFSTKPLGKGTGFGLSTALKIVKEHGGFINVYSQVNKGSKFQVFLPAINMGKPDDQYEDIDVEKYQGNGELILVVDDEVKIRQITKKILENYSYQVMTASSGIEAIALYCQYQHIIKIVLMDIIMPDMDGIIATHTLKKINPHVEVIVCTGMNTWHTLESINNIQVKSILFKPYTNKELLRKLKELIMNN